MKIAADSRGLEYKSHKTRYNLRSEQISFEFLSKLCRIKHYYIAVMVNGFCCYFDLFLSSKHVV